MEGEDSRKLSSNNHACAGHIPPTFPETASPQNGRKSYPAVLQAGVKIQNLQRIAKVKYQGNKSCQSTNRRMKGTDFCQVAPSSPIPELPLAEEGNMEYGGICLHTTAVTIPEHIPTTAL